MTMSATVTGVHFNRRTSIEKSIRTCLLKALGVGEHALEDERKTGVDHPEQLCDAIAGIVDELEEAEVIRDDRAAELRSEIYRAVDIPDDDADEPL